MSELFLKGHVKCIYDLMWKSRMTFTWIFGLSGYQHVGTLIKLIEVLRLTNVISQVPPGWRMFFTDQSLHIWLLWGEKNKKKTHFWLHKMAVSNSFMVCSWPGGDECGSHMDFTAIGGGLETLVLCSCLLQINETKKIVVATRFSNP